MTVVAIPRHHRHGACGARAGRRRREVIVNAILGVIVCGACLLAQQEPVQDAAQADSEERIFVGRPDGSGMKLLSEIEDYRPQRSPTWSSDGKRIAFDAWRSARGEKSNNSKIIVVNA